jgi:hypothetical protein
MRALVSLLVRLYPHVWRRRYEAEFRDLLLERGLSLTDVFDIISGALDAHFRLVKGDFSSMKGKRQLQTAGIVGLLSALLMSAAIINRTAQGWFDASLMLAGMALLLPTSILLHAGNRQYDIRHANRMLTVTVVCLSIGIVVFVLLRQQPNGALTLGWQNIYIGGTFGLWIGCNSHLASAVGLLPRWCKTLGITAGALWFMMTLAMLGIELQSTELAWMIVVFAVAAVWLAVHLIWLISLAAVGFAAGRGQHVVVAR